MAYEVILVCERNEIDSKRMHSKIFKNGFKRVKYVTELRNCSIVSTSKGKQQKNLQTHNLLAIVFRKTGFLKSKTSCAKI